MWLNHRWRGAGHAHLDIKKSKCSCKVGARKGLHHSGWTRPIRSSTGLPICRQFNRRYGCKKYTKQRCDTTCSPLSVTRMRRPRPGCTTMYLPRQMKPQTPYKTSSHMQRIYSHCPMQSKAEMHDFSRWVKATAANLHPHVQRARAPCSCARVCTAARRNKLQSDGWHPSKLNTESQL